MKKKFRETNIIARINFDEFENVLLVFGIFELGISITEQNLLPKYQGMVLIKVLLEQI